MFTNISMQEFHLLLLALPSSVSRVMVLTVLISQHDKCHLWIDKKVRNICLFMPFPFGL